MERLTYVTEEGEVLFHPAELPDDEGVTITQLAKAGRYKELKQIAERLANREQAEENGLLLRLPCKIGDTVYVIPSKVNYKLNILNRHEENNRVYEQKVEEIRLCHDGQYLLVTCDGVCGVVSDFYKENWFLSREEAESKLAEMEGNHE